MTIEIPDEVIEKADQAKRDAEVAHAYDEATSEKRGLEAFAAVIAEWATERERERCAKVAIGHIGLLTVTAAKIVAEAIRRGEPEGEGT